MVLESKRASVSSSAIKVLFNMCAWQVKVTICLIKHSYIYTGRFVPVREHTLGHVEDRKVLH